MSADERDARNVLASLRPPESDLAFRDDLTGLYNSRLLTSLLDERWPELAALCGSLSLMIIDLDLFKQVNDRYGHLSGDDVLRVTAGLLRQHFRNGDMIFRYGGDEFVVLLPGASSHEAGRLAARAREAMHAQEFFTREERARIDVPLSFSVGIAAWPDDGIKGRTLLATADGRLYAQKRVLAKQSRVRRRLVWWLAAALGAVLVTAAFVNLADRGTAELSRVPRTIIRPVRQNDANLRLEIEQLQTKIAELTREREQQSEADRKASAAEIERLQVKIGDLGSRLAPPPVATAAPEHPIVATETHAPSAPAEPPAVTTAAAESPVRAAEEAPLIPARLLVPVVPRYPRMARERQIEALIDVRVLIDEKGRVVRAGLLGKPAGYGFDEAARAALTQSSWRPATRGGVAVPIETTVRVAFKIKNG